MNFLQNYNVEYEWYHQEKFMTENVLKTSHERMRLLKKGMQGKKIEELYIQNNNLKIIHSPILFDFTQPLKGIAKRKSKT